MTIARLIALLSLLEACGGNREAADITFAQEVDAIGYGEGTRCGSWQESYSKLHRSILSGEQPGRYAISIPPRQGLSDRLVGIVTVFVYALLTNRAIQISDAPDIQPLEWVYSQPNINWTVTGANSNLWVPGSGETSGESWVYFDLENADLSPGVKNETLRMFEEKSLSNLGGDKDVVYIELNRGRSVKLFRNEHHRTQLNQLGLTYATAFGCILEFLFRPVPQMLEYIVPEVRQMRGVNTFTIGIQIRMGDHVLLGGDPYVNVSQPEVAQFFSCAQQIEGSLPRALRHHKVLWLLVSDSASLRKAAAVEYGQKLITKLDLTPGHSYTQSSDEKKPGQKFSDRDKEAFRFAAAEQYLLGMADAHVITRESGFGRVAAFRARNKEGWLFELSLKQVTASCSVGIDHTPLEVAVSHHAGISAGI